MTSRRLITACWLVAVLGFGVAFGASNLVVPGDATIGDDLTVTDDVSVGDDMIATGVVGGATEAITEVRQCILYEWSESSHFGKAYPDTFAKIGKVAWFAPPVAGTIFDITMFMDDAGSGWDSLTIDVLAGDSGDSSVFVAYKYPLLEPGDGDKANTEVDGRSAELNGTISNIAAGETVFLEGETNGNKSDCPAGLKVWLWFQPDYAP